MCDECDIGITEQQAAQIMAEIDRTADRRGIDVAKFIERFQVVYVAEGGESLANTPGEDPAWAAGLVGRVGRAPGRPAGPVALDGRAAPPAQRRSAPALAAAAATTPPPHTTAPLPPHTHAALTRFKPPPPNKPGSPTVSQLAALPWSCWAACY